MPAVPSLVFNWTNEKESKQLGDGAYSAVYDALVLRDSSKRAERVALKVMWKAQIQKLQKCHAVVRERRICDRLAQEVCKKSNGSSEHLCKLLFTSKDHERLFMAFELCEGGDLLQVAEAQTGLCLERTQHLCLQLVQALSLLHSLEIIHGDVKPENCLLDGSKSHLKLTDFGSAIDLHELSNPLERIDFAGSVEYAPPEVLFRAMGITYASDVYGVALVACAAVVGSRPDRHCLLNEGATGRGIDLPAILDPEDRSTKDTSSAAVCWLRKLVDFVTTPIDEGRPQDADIEDGASMHFSLEEECKVMVDIDLTGDEVMEAREEEGSEQLDLLDLTESPKQDVRPYEQQCSNGEDDGGEEKHTATTNRVGILNDCDVHSNLSSRQTRRGILSAEERAFRATVNPKRKRDGAKKKEETRENTNNQNNTGAENNAAAKASAKERREAETERKKAQRGVYKMAELTVAIDNKLINSGIGNEATLALQRSKMFYCVCANLIDSTVEFWRHPRRSEPFDPARESTSSADSQRVPYVLVVMDSDRAADLHEHASHNFASGLESFVHNVQQQYGNAAVSLCMHSCNQQLNHRERRDPTFARNQFDKALTRLCVSHQNVRQATMHERSHVADHIANIAISVAWQPYWQYETILDLFNDKQEASRRATSDTAAAAGRNEVLSAQDAWFRALNNLRGIGEPSARGICRVYPTMFEFMQMLTDTTFDVETRKQMVSQLTRVDTDGKHEHQKIGRAVADRLFALFGPRPSDDNGADIIAPGTL